VADASGGTSTDTFFLTVNATNDLPTISNISDQTINEDTTTTAIGFTVGDVETGTASLTLTGSSSSTTVVPSTNIVFGGSGANRTITLTPAANQSGTSTITVTVTDASGTTATDKFVITVTSINDLPTISNIADQSINEDVATTIAFTVGDLETSAAALTLTGSSSNATLVPNGNIVFSGSGGNRTVTLTPAANLSGTSTITVTVADASGGTAADTFLLTVNAVNDPPTISDITSQTSNGDAVTKTVAFSVSDVETSSASLILTGISSNTTVVPSTGIVFGGSGANRTLTLTPEADQFGMSTITVTVADANGSMATDTFMLMVGPSSTPAPEPAGAYVLSQASLGPTGLIDPYNDAIAAETASGKDLFVGYVLRVAMDDLITNDNDTSGAIQYDFSPIINAITAIQQETQGVRVTGTGDPVSLQMLVWPQLLNNTPQPPPILLAQIPDNEEYVNDGVTLPVPWSVAGVTVLTDFYAALANVPITDYSQPGDPTVLLKDHPTLVGINVALIGHKGYRDNNSTTKIPTISGYDRDLYVAGLLGSIAAATTAFPHDFGFVEYFGFNDQQDSLYEGETLDQRVDRELDTFYNGPGQSSFGVWRENLTEDSPTVASGQNLLDYEAEGFVDDPEGHVLFQSVRNWIGAQSDYAEGETDSGTVTNAMLFGYTQYGARYLEVYGSDIALNANNIKLTFEGILGDIPSDAEAADIQVTLEGLLVAWNAYLVSGPGVVADAAIVSQDSGVNTIGVMLNDAPPPGPGPWDNPNTDFPTAADLLKLTVTDVTQGANGSVSIALNGSDVTYTPNVGFSGTDSFTYIVSDGHGGTATASVLVTVVP
jgi:hypothetical protein